MKDGEVPISVTAIYGRAATRAWFEMDGMNDDGSLRLVGMGSRTDYDRDGKLVGHTIAPTGIVMSCPTQARPWWKRLFSS